MEQSALKECESYETVIYLFFVLNVALLFSKWVQMVKGRAVYVQEQNDPDPEEKASGALQRYN